MIGIVAPMVRRPSTLSVRRLVTGLCVLAALAATGCGSSARESAAAGGPGHSGAAPAAGATSSPAPTPTTGGATTASVTTPGTPSGRPAPGTGKPAVTIGDENYTEQFVLGQLYVQALRAQGFHVSISQDIGPPAVFTQALKSGTLAMYPEYLSTFDETIAHTRAPRRSAAAAYQAAQLWAQAHGLTLLAPTPFSDTDAVAVTDAYAAAHHLRTLGDLRRVGATLVMGGAAQFAAGAPGLTTLSDIYGVYPAAFRALAVGDQYTELDNGLVQAAYVHTTDGQLASGDYRLLRDTKGIFGVGNVVPVVSTAALAKEGPAFAVTIERVDRLLTGPVMRQLNSEVDVAKQTPAAVATQFLQTRGLLAPLPASAY